MLSGEVISDVGPSADLDLRRRETSGYGKTRGNPVLLTPPIANTAIAKMAIANTAIANTAIANTATDNTDR